MKVKIAQKIWGMTRQEFEKVIKVAGEQVPFGVYAVVKGDYAELMNVKCSSKSELKCQKHQLKQQGYKVYYNG